MMGFRFVKYVANGTQVDGWAVQKFKDADTGALQLRLKKNGRTVARKTFNTDLDFALFVTDTVGANDTRHETIIKLKDALR